MYIHSSIIICMHAYALHIITLKHCHIVAAGMTLLQLPLVSIADIRSAFVETLVSERFRRITIDDAL